MTIKIKDVLVMKKTIEDDAWYTANLRSNEVNNPMIALGMFRASNIITNFILNEIAEKPVDNSNIEVGDYSLYNIGKSHD